MADCLFPVVKANFTDTRWTLLQKILCGTNAIVAGGSGSANGQVMIYTAGSNPNADGLVPTDPTKPAVAYSSDGSGSVYGWSGSAWV